MPLNEITRGHAEDFNVWLRAGRESKLSEGTARRRVKRCKQFFAAAVKRRIIDANPFDGIRCSSFSEDRFHFVSQADAEAILEACPDLEWRLIFALARWGGMRVPSEILDLQWSDVDWERQQFTVHSPKTAGHDGKGSRIVPIFPELAPLFRDAFEAAEEGAEYIITRYRSSNQNLRTHLLRIIKRAGVAPWPKLFVNLRATRASDLVESFPAHVCAAWLGHSTEIARKHYLMVTREHFDRASGKALQKARQQLRARPRSGGNEDGVEPDLQASAQDSTPLHMSMVPLRGLEPLSPG